MKYALIVLSLCALIVANDANQSKFSSFFDANSTTKDTNSTTSSKSVKIPTH
ncbi:MAG: hypothetical protein MR902_05740 [Campylobacter sp.]|nr:hypothetical protein [Campylobacter sp.]